MKRWLLIAGLLLVSAAAAAELGERIYLYGIDLDGNPIAAQVNGLQSASPLACANCHRESGLGTSESGKTIPPVSWRYLGQPYPVSVDKPFRTLQNQRPAYDFELLHRLLTEGVDSRGRVVDQWMPRYRMDPEQTAQLMGYLQTLYAGDDPGVDADSLYIATIVDRRLDAGLRRQHIEFISGLFGMKNSLTRGELNRKQYAPVQKAPQYTAYRKWQLQVWELPEDTAAWSSRLEQLYRDRPVFVVLAPLVRDGYGAVQKFCREWEVPCLFPQGNGEFSGDFYNFVFQNRQKQRADFIARTLRQSERSIYALKPDGSIGRVEPGAASVRPLDAPGLAALREHYPADCGLDGRLLLEVNVEQAGQIYALDCAGERRLGITLIGDESVDYAAIAQLLQENPHNAICWATDYDKMLKRNTREVRVRLLTRKFGITEYIGERMAMNLFAFGLLSDTMAQLAGNFSRKYLLENLEHMLNSYPNQTYFSSVTGAPYQRAIVGPYREFCPRGSAA